MLGAELILHPRVEVDLHLGHAILRHREERLRFAWVWHVEEMMVIEAGRPVGLGLAPECQQTYFAILNGSSNRSRTAVSYPERAEQKRRNSDSTKRSMKTCGTGDDWACASLAKRARSFASKAVCDPPPPPQTAFAH